MAQLEVCISDAQEKNSRTLSGTLVHTHLGEVRGLQSKNQESLQRSSDYTPVCTQDMTRARLVYVDRKRTQLTRESWVRVKVSSEQRG